MLRRALRDNGLSLFFLLIFAAALIAQAIAGHAAYNDDQVMHAQLEHQSPETLSFWRYLTSSSFGNAVMENWQSEYLQFTIYVLATIWLVQRGSSEYKETTRPASSPTPTSRWAGTSVPDRRSWPRPAAGGC